jgi:hypothetical protein
VEHRVQLRTSGLTHLVLCGMISVIRSIAIHCSQKKTLFQ